jgi:ribonuclease HI
MKIRIYTDGACSGNPGPGGWGAVILFKNDKQEIAGFEFDTTNNRMELKAVLEALRLAIKVVDKDCRIELYSDSAYVVNAIKDKWIKKWQENGWKTKDRNDVKNKDLWLKLLNLLDKHRNITFIKVKGHSDNVYNNRCDKMARAQVEKIKNI